MPQINQKEINQRYQKYRVASAITSLAEMARILTKCET
jgi:hypothetical protein